MKFTLLLILATFIRSNEAGKLLDKVRHFGYAQWDKYNEKVPYKLNPLNLVYRNSCIADLGCFYTGPPFYHPIDRPISVSPSKKVHKIKFLLFTSQHPLEEYKMEPDLDSIEMSDFDPSLSTIILVHGFMAHLDRIEIRVRLKDALLENGDYNVIICDWTALNVFPYYRSAANTRIVGAKLAKLIQSLMATKGVKAETFHIIGHSFGAHVAGYAGERVPNIGRITGLDPVGSYFRFTAPEVRLDPSDALFVDVIHTNGADLFTGGLGMKPPVGHMDFYPNGGKHQPGCVHGSKMPSVIGKRINESTQYLNMFCDHGRANLYFLESISYTDCKFLAVQCANYTEYEKGHCQARKSHVAEMGFQNKMIPRLEFPAMFFLRTNKQQPFCNQYSYKIKAPSKLKKLGGKIGKKLIKGMLPFRKK